MTQPYPSPKHPRHQHTPHIFPFDRIMYVVALIGPVLTIPQVILVWSNRQTQGISLSTWIAYTVASGLWLTYGILHRQKPLIFSQVLLFVLDGAVVVGVLVYR